MRIDKANCHDILKRHTICQSGLLLFVTVQHCYYQHGQLCISEEQSVVYRDP